MECHIVTLVFACILFCRPRPAKARFLAAVDKHKKSDAGRPHKIVICITRPETALLRVRVVLQAEAFAEACKYEYSQSSFWTCVIHISDTHYFLCGHPA